MALKLNSEPKRNMPDKTRVQIGNLMIDDIIYDSGAIRMPPKTPQNKYNHTKKGFGLFSPSSKVVPNVKDTYSSKKSKVGSNSNHKRASMVN